MATPTPEHRLRMLFVKAEFNARVKLVSELGYGLPLIKTEYWPPTNGNIRESLVMCASRQNGRDEYTRTMCAFTGVPYWKDQGTQTNH